ncbi:MAG: hypothetical protein JSS66_18205 [Armatimonadetes bacterium]|nr:hypothetical protein [Armatimonadota bacterium]
MHERKKQGHRKDKKTRNMREAEMFKRAMHVERPTSDQHDIVGYKPGSRGDDNRHILPPVDRPDASHSN